MKADSKWCSRCRQHLPLDSFSKSTKQKDGRNNYCKSCASSYSKQRYKQRIEQNPALHLLRRSCEGALRRSKPDYVKDGYANVTSSYTSAKKFCSDLWDDDQFRTTWVSQTNIYTSSGNYRDRPTLDRIDSSKGYEKENIQMLPHWQNVTDGAQKDCHVYVIKNTRVDEKIDYSSIGEARKAISTRYHIPMKALNCVDHGTMVDVGEGVNLLIQTSAGKLKPQNGKGYLMVINLHTITYDLDTGVEMGEVVGQHQVEVNGIEIRPLVS